MDLILSNRNEALNQIRQAVINTALPDIVRKNKNAIQQKATDLFLQLLNEHKVVRGLLGDYANDEIKDLQAIFGLSDEQANEAVNGMNQLVTELLLITVETRPRSVVVSFRVPNIERAFEDNYGSYTYQSKRFKDTPITIPWIQWLFEGGQTEAGITFDVELFRGEGPRSGRALMTNQEEPWSFSPFDVSRTGSLFLDVVRSRLFKEKMQSLLISYISTGA